MGDGGAGGGGGGPSGIGAGGAFGDFSGDFGGPTGGPSGMGPGGVFGDFSGDFGNASGESGVSESSNMGLSIAQASVAAMRAQEGGMGHGSPFGGADVSGEGDGPSGLDSTPAVQKIPEPEKEKKSEQKEGIKRKARKRSLLNDEEKTVYRRSILGG